MPRVLVVEDDASIAAVIAEDLADRGFEGVTVRNGAEALAELDRPGTDAIVLDLMMPVFHGWAFIERSREHSGVPRFRS